MLVQKRGCGEEADEVVTVRISTGWNWHDVSIGATASFGTPINALSLCYVFSPSSCYLPELPCGVAGELKTVVAIVTGMEPREQRLLFRGKEREDGDHLHMVGVRDKDKVLLLEDPAIKERKLRDMGGSHVASNRPCHTIIEV